MSRDLVTAICAPLPGAAVSDPWGGGHDCWKVGGKMFANVGGYGDGVDVKCPDLETARLLIDLGGVSLMRLRQLELIPISKNQTP